MSCYLAEVLSSVEKMELEEINIKSPEIAINVDKCKTELLSYLEEVYVRFLERPRQNKALAAKIKKLVEEMTGIKNHVEQITRKELNQSGCELKKHLDSLSQANTAISLVSTWYNIHESLVKINELQRNCQFLKCMQQILDVQDVITNLQPEENLPILQETSLTLMTERGSLLNNLSNLFRDNVIMKAGDRTVMKIIDDCDQLKEVLSALYLYKTLVTPLDNVTKFLWNHVFVPVVDGTTEIKTDVENGFATIEIITVDANKKSSYMEVFANLKTVLNFLSNNFNISLNEEISTLHYIGRDLRDNLSELIIKRCLQDTIPSTKEGLQQYKVVIEATKDLEEVLVLSGIFASDTCSILEYANNIDVLFINKKCQGYIMAAEELMKKDLHDLVEVGQSQESVTGLEITTEFPHCSISHNVIDLLNLLEEILTQATTSSEVCAGRLFVTVRNICLKYGIFVPRHHKKLLQTIPQQIALFYNNCTYISFKLSEWNTTFLKKLPAILNIHANSFNDEGRQLREIASEKFNSYVDSQIKQIEEIMKESGLQRRTLEQLEASTEKCVRQCLRQQELLKTVWHKVLPYTVYNKTLGEILNSLCIYLINVVVRMEDITSDAGEQLVELLKMVQTRGPKLFSDAKEVSLFVASWYKLNELTLILNASLVDINDRWADGKGPLALQFKAEEVRQLIRALFQNTERRAVLLARIYD